MSQLKLLAFSEIHKHVSDVPGSFKGAPHMGLILLNDHFLKCTISYPYPRLLVFRNIRYVCHSSFMLIVLLSNLCLGNPASATSSSFKVVINIKGFLFFLHVCVPCACLVPKRLEEIP